MKLSTVMSVGVIWAIICVIFMVIAVWVGGSVLVSGVKSVKNQCGQTYPMESVFSGDWFCAEEKK